MRDVFYTILIIWVVWKIIGAFNRISSSRSSYSRNQHQNTNQPEGKTSIKYSPPKEQKISDDEGEYVDFEELK